MLRLYSGGSLASRRRALLRLPEQSAELLKGYRAWFGDAAFPLGDDGLGDGRLGELGLGESGCGTSLTARSSSGGEFSIAETRSPTATVLVSREKIL